MKKLVDVLECPQKAEYKSILNEDMLAIKPVQFKICFRKMLDRINKDVSNINTELIDECFSDYFQTCVMKKEREENRNLLIVKLNRFKKVFRHYQYKIIDVNLKLKAPFNEVSQIDNTAIIDIIYKDENDIINCVNVKEGSIKCSESRRAKKAYVGFNPAFYCVWKLARAYFHEDVKVGEWGLLAKGEDTRIKVASIDAFEFQDIKKMSSLCVTATFENDDIQDMEEIISEVHGYPWKKGFVKKTSDNSKCNNCSYRSLCRYQETTPPAKKTESVGKKAPSNMQFTDAQQSFITDGSGYIRVIASAGSGKTTCLINRVVYLIQKGNCDIEDFLMITFTEKGASEIKEKLAYWLNDNGFDSKPDDFGVYTFNSFGNKIIQENYELFGFTKMPTLIDSVNSMKIIQKILDEVPYKIEGQNYRLPLMRMFRAAGVVPYMQSVITMLKLKNINTPEELAALPDVVMTTETATNVLDIYKRYKEEMLKDNLIDFSDQVYMAHKLLKENPSIADNYTFKHIVIDEAQDTSPEQFQLMDVILERGQTESFVVVGDDAQAIYSFRGVDMGNLVNFDKTYSSRQVKDYFLLDNFRSTKEIIEVADSVIKTNECNIQKEMIPHRSGSNPYIYKNPADMKDSERVVIEAKKVVEDIEIKMQTHGLKPGEIAVIARRKNELLEVSKLLNEKRIPNVVAFPEYFIDSPIIAGIAGLLNIFMGKTETLKTAQYMQVFAKEEFEAAYDLTVSCEMKAAVIKEAIEPMDDLEKMNYFKELISPLKNRVEVKSLYRLFEEKDIQSLGDQFKCLSDMFTYGSDASYSVYEENQEAIVLTTAHSAKGKEWEYVAIMLNYMLPKRSSFEKGKFTKTALKLKPSSFLDLSTDEQKAYGSQEEIDEQEETTRLLFVAVTRAKTLLTMVY